jgi:hypothetical protein
MNSHSTYKHTVSRQYACEYAPLDRNLWSKQSRNVCIYRASRLYASACARSKHHSGCKCRGREYRRTVSRQCECARGLIDGNVVWICSRNACRQTVFPRCALAYEPSRHQKHESYNRNTDKRTAFPQCEFARAFLKGWQICTNSHIGHTCMASRYENACANSTKLSDHNGSRRGYTQTAWRQWD